LINSNIKKITI